MKLFTMYSETTYLRLALNKQVRCVIGPRLLLLYVSDLPDALDTWPLLFADDVKLVT